MTIALEYLVRVWVVVVHSWIIYAAIFNIKRYTGKAIYAYRHECYYEPASFWIGFCVFYLLLLVTGIVSACVCYSHWHYVPEIIQAVIGSA